MTEDGFFKIRERGSTFITGDFFNPVTKELKVLVLRDYDYSDCSRDNDELYQLPIDRDALEAYNAYNGIISEGCMVRVVKGRKVPVGYEGIVVKMKKIYDMYGRFICNYVFFADGQKTSEENCERL